MRATVLATLLSVLLAAPVLAEPWEFRQIDLDEDTRLEYALVLPKGFDPARAYPTVLVLPPGPQNRQMVLAAIAPWAAEARKRGWIVVSPAVPGFEMFFSGAERHLPHLLAALRRELRFEHDACHLFGLSNGGRSAFRVATLSPDDYLSVTVAPGFPLAVDEERLEVLTGKPVTLIVGSEDDGWLERSRETRTRLEALGIQAKLEELPGVGHAVLRGYSAERVMAALERARADAAKAPTR